MHQYKKISMRYACPLPEDINGTKNSTRGNHQLLLTCAVVVFVTEIPSKDVYAQVHFASEKYLLSLRNFQSRTEFRSRSLLVASRKTHRPNVSALAVNLLRQKRKKCTLAETLCQRGDLRIELQAPVHCSLDSALLSLSIPFAQSLDLFYTFPYRGMASVK